MNILDFIPVGKENAIGRDLLAIVVKLCDRTVRRLIEDSRERAKAINEVVVNLQDGSGYYIAKNRSDVKTQWLIIHSRRVALHKQEKALEKILKEAGSFDGWEGTD